MDCHGRLKGVPERFGIQVDLRGQSLQPSGRDASFPTRVGPIIGA